MDLDLEDEELFILVGAGEEDYDTGKILITSPIGPDCWARRSARKLKSRFLREPSISKSFPSKVISAD